MTLVDSQTLSRLTQEARENPRGRKNANFHGSNDDRCHRLLNAVEPGSYIRPHRHLDPQKGEAMVLLAGRLGVLIFSEAGELEESHLLDRDAGALMVDIPAGTFHSAVSLAPGSVFFEAKAGPYAPLGEAEVPAWAPREGDPEAGAYLAWMVARFAR